MQHLESAVCTCGTPKTSEQVHDGTLCAFAQVATRDSAVPAASLPLHALLLVTNTSRKTRLRIIREREVIRRGAPTNNRPRPCLRYNTLSEVSIRPQTLSDV